MLGGIALAEEQLAFLQVQAGGMALNTLQLLIGEAGQQQGPPQFFHHDQDLENGISRRDGVPQRSGAAQVGKR